MAELVEYRPNPCIGCGVQAVLQVDAEKLRRWQAGEPLADVFADEDANFRETLMSGIHGDCFDAMFPERDDDLPEFVFVGRDVS